MNIFNPMYPTESAQQVFLGAEDFASIIQRVVSVTDKSNQAMISAFNDGKRVHIAMYGDSERMKQLLIKLLTGSEDFRVALEMAVSELAE